jgi:tetratricopeptide (TPR) repeat protein
MRMDHSTAEDLLAGGWVEYQEKRGERALEYFREALAACPPDALPGLRAEIHVAIGKTQRDLEGNQDALSHYRSAAELYRSAEDEMGLAHAIRHVADILRGMNRTQEAETLIFEAISIYRKQLYQGQQHVELHLANGLRVAALLKEQAGLNVEALPFWVEARDNYRAAGVHAGVAESRAHLAAAHGA